MKNKSREKQLPTWIDIEGPEGVEGWERMYDINAYAFTPDGVDAKREEYEQSMMWVLDSLHQPVLPLPLSQDFYDTVWWPRLSQFDTHVWCVPPALGLDHRMLYGWTYLTSVPVPDPEEVEKRAEIFNRRIGYYWQHWQEAYENLKEKQTRTADEINALVFKEPPYIVEEDEVTNFNGTYYFTEIEKNWRTLVNLWEEGFDYHFELFNIGHATHLAFVAFCKNAFAGISDGVIGQMISGEPCDLFRADVESRKLAQNAVKLGVADEIMEPGEWNEVEAKLKKNDAGKKWLADLEEIKYPWFYFTTGYAYFMPTDKSWIEDMNLPLESIRGYIKALKAGVDLHAPFKNAKESADHLAREYRDLLPTEEDKKVFDDLLATDRKISPMIEGHSFWFECLHNAPVRWKFNDLGKIFTTYGYMSEPDDIWYLRMVDVEELIKDVVRTSATFGKIEWAPGQKGTSAYYWFKEIAERKRIFEKLKSWQPPAIVGPVPEEITNPFFVGLWGITTENLKLWQSGGAEFDGETDELSGFSAAPNVAEGIARVLLDVSRIEEVKPGEILVCKTTAPSWGPVFSVIKAVVTDMGGMMSHSAIVSREYGIPSVTGTVRATTAIKSGDIVRVNGDTGKVLIVQRIDEV